MVVFLQFSGVGLLFLLQVLLAKVMGEQEYGIYVYCLNWIYLLVLFCKMGLDTALLRFVPQYLVKGMLAEAYGLATRAFQLTGVSSVAAAVVLSTVVLMGAGVKGEHLLKTFQFGAVLLPIIALLKISQSVIQSLKRVVVAQILEGIFVPSALMLTVLIGHQAGFLISAPFVMAAMVGIASIALFFSWGVINKISALFCRQVEKKFEERLWVTAALPFMLITGMLLLLSYLDTIMVGMLVNPTESGIYSVASRLAMFTAFLLATLNSAVAPYVSGYIAENNYRRVQLVLSRITLASFIFASVFCLFLLFWGKDVLAIFSPAFTVGYQPLLVLLAGQLINTGSGSVGMLMNLSGRQNVAVLFIGCALFINVVLNFLLIPKYGMLGASTATTISIASWNIGLAVYINKELRIDTTMISSWRLLR